MLVLFTDTDTDITPVKAAEYGYKLISMPYTTDEGTVYPYVDFDEFDDKKFYDMLRGGTLPTTSAISTEKYKEYFEPYFKNGDDILYVHFSAAMTMTFNNMDQAVRELSEKYGKTNFYTVDTKGITVASYIIVDEIGAMYRAGAGAREILEWAEKEVDHFSTYFYANDLKFFKRSGRVSGISAAMGTLIGVRPIIHMNREGKMVSIGKERGKKSALNRLLSYMEEYGQDITQHKIVIANTDCPEDVELFTSMVREKYGRDVIIETVATNPTAGSHCGPNCLGVAFHSKGRE